MTVAKFTAELARVKRLRGDLEEWSNAFYLKHGRRPTTQDVERTGIDFLVENFQEYVRLRDKLMSQTPYLRGQIEDVARDTLQTDARRFGRRLEFGRVGARVGSGVRSGVRSRFAVTSAASAAATRANANGQVHGGTVAKFTPLKMSGAAVSAAEKAMKRAAAYQNKNRSESAERRGGAKPTLNSGPGPGDAAGEAMRRAAAYKSGKAKPSGNHPGAPVSEGAGAAAKEAMRRRARVQEKRRRRKPAAKPPPGRRRRRRKRR